MFQIPQRQYWSGTGETALQKSKFDKDSADARANTRAFADQMATQHTQTENAFALPSQSFISQMAQPTPQAPQPRILQLLNQVVARPLQAVQVLIQNMTQQAAQLLNQAGLQQMPGFMEKAVNQALSFFFGNTKEGGKDDATEKEKRDRNEETMFDIFGDTKQAGSKIEQKANTGLGSGSK